MCHKTPCPICVDTTGRTSFPYQCRNIIEDENSEAYFHNITILQKLFSKKLESPPESLEAIQSGEWKRFLSALQNAIRSTPELHTTLRRQTIHSDAGAALLSFVNNNNKQQIFLSPAYNLESSY